MRSTGSIKGSEQGGYFSAYRKANIMRRQYQISGSSALAEQIFILSNSMNLNKYLER